MLDLLTFAVEHARTVGALMLCAGFSICVALWPLPPLVSVKSDHTHNHGGPDA